ncbi:MAG TPA: putative sugar O-methyltransferase [Acidobacteriaceae bacterium]|jgi:putative sugar O-methyltransferase
MSLAHPLRLTANVRARLKSRMEMRSRAREARQHFKNDPRFDPQLLQDGFRSRLADKSDDTELLQRIVSAYRLATAQEANVPTAYRPTAWWERVRATKLGPVRQALFDGDIPALNRMYSNFFRDPCGAGLTGLPQFIAKDCFGTGLSKAHSHFILGDALHRLDLWKQRSHGETPLQDLRGTDVGNPFGILFEDTLVRTRSEYHHFTARRLASRMKPGASTVAELGGGYGETAYYLLRDTPGITYINFDVPETIALASYYLMKTLPGLPFTLYGEGDPHEASREGARVILMPVSELPHFPGRSADVVLSAHTLSDLSAEAVDEYLRQVERITRCYFQSITVGPAAERIHSCIRSACPRLGLVEWITANWNGRMHGRMDEMETLYRLTAPRVTGATSKDLYPADPAT